MKTDIKKIEEIQAYISGDLESDPKKCFELEVALLENGDFFEKFIEESERSVLAAPKDFAFSVMAKLEPKKAAARVPFTGKKLGAAICFCNAAAIMLMSAFGITDKIFGFILDAAIPEKIQKIGEFLNIAAKFGPK